MTYHLKLRQEKPRKDKMEIKIDVLIGLYDAKIRDLEHEKLFLTAEVISLREELEKELKEKQNGLE